MPSSSGIRLRLAVSLLFTFTLHAGPCVAQNLTFRPGWSMFSPAQDVQLGRENAAEVDKELPLLRDADTEAYVSDLGRRLRDYAPDNQNEYVWQFKVVNSEEINALALPGGFIYVNRGTIESAQDEAQLAGVIAHEEGHVVMRHGTHQASEQMLAQAPLAIVGGLLGQESGLMSELVKLGIGLGVNSLFLHNSRDAEAEADGVGAYILYQAGYDPHAMAQFFEIVEQKYPQRTVQFVSDHPNPGNRIQYVDAEIPNLGPAKAWKTDNILFEAVKRRVGEMPPLSASTLVLASATPSAGYKLLQQRDFIISYPDSWEVLGSQSPSVTIAPHGGITGNVVAYGAIISSYEPRNGRTSSLEESTRELVDTLLEANPRLRVVSHKRNQRANGRQADSVELVSEASVPDERGAARQERDWLVAIDRGGGSLKYVVFIAPESDFQDLRPTFERMLTSFEVK